MIDYEKEADPRLYVRENGHLRRELMRITLYRFTVEEILERVERRTEREREWDHPGEEQRILFHQFVCALADGWEEWNILRDGSRCFPFTISDITVDNLVNSRDGKIVAELRCSPYPRRRERWEKVYKALERVGYTEQMDALAAGVPLAYVFPEEIPERWWEYDRRTKR